MARFNLGRQRGENPSQRSDVTSRKESKQSRRFGGGGAGGWLRDGRAGGWGGCSNLEIISKVKFKYPPESGRKEKQTRRHSVSPRCTDLRATDWGGGGGGELKQEASTWMKETEGVISSLPFRFSDRIITKTKARGGGGAFRGEKGFAFIQASVLNLNRPGRSLMAS